MATTATTTTTPMGLKALVFTLLILLANEGHTRTTASFTTYNVPKQTPAQAAAFEQINLIAQEASAAATPALLEYLDTQAFRDSIANLPAEITSLSSEDLLALLNETVALSLITHGIYASVWGNFNPASFDVTLDMLIQLNLTFIPNLWQRIAIGNLDPSSQEIAMIVENAAETHVMLLPKFNSSFAQVTLEEASQRCSYTAVDIYRLSESGQFFGNMQMVLNPTYAKPMMVISPYDTGNFAACCILNSTQIPPSLCASLNFTKSHRGCGNLTMGTFYHMSHLYAQNMDYWGVPLITNLLQRFFAQPEPLASLGQEAIYFEGDLLGNILIPDAIQYVIGDFSTLFGKEKGVELQNWCISQGLPLVWTIAIPNAFYGTFSKNSTLNAPQNESFLDPIVLPTSSVANISMEDQAVATELFSLAWKLIDTTLATNASMQNNTKFWQDSFEDLFSSIPSTMHLNQLRPFLCSDEAHCFGTDDNNTCLCRYPPSSAVGAE